MNYKKMMNDILNEKREKLTQKEKEDLIDLGKKKGLYLDDEPAKITGSKLDSALISPTDINSDKKVEFSWLTVKKIMNKHRKFYS